MNLTYINWNASPSMFSMGNFEMRWYGFLFLMGFFLAYMVLYYVFKKEGIKARLLDILTVYIFFATVIGARLGHVFFYEWSYYQNHIDEIFMPWKGGLASHGAGFVIILALVFYVLRYKVRPLWLCDRISIVIPIVAAFVRLGNLMNSEIYGTQTSLPWGFVFSMDPTAGALPRHPTQLYEALLYLFITGLLFFLWRKKTSKVREGLLVGLFLIIMFAGRFLIEFVKTEQMPFEKGMALDMGQWLSIPFVLLGIGFLIIAFVRKNTPEIKEEKQPTQPVKRKNR
jgi:phosphatidylglycerol:prolipoprotein diacylglycerol transferase